VAGRPGSADRYRVRHGRRHDVIECHLPYRVA
jgi:hypothetical protein